MGFMDYIVKLSKCAYDSQIETLSRRFNLDEISKDEDRTDTADKPIQTVSKAKSQNTQLHLCPICKEYHY